MPFAHLLEASRCHLMLSPQLLQQWLRRRYSHVLASCSPRRARAEGDANARATNQVVRLARQAANAAPAIVSGPRKNIRHVGAPSVGSASGVQNPAHCKTDRGKCEKKVERHTPGSRARRRSGVDPRGSLAKVRLSHGHSQRVRAHMHATPSLCSQERAHRFGTRAVALARHPLAPPNRRMPRCTMTSVPATTLATADKEELRMVTQRSTIGASSRSSPQAVLFTRQVAPHHACDRFGASQQGRPRGGGRRKPREGDRLALQFDRLRSPTALSASHDLRHHAASCSRCSGLPLPWSP